MSAGLTEPYEIYRNGTKILPTEIDQYVDTNVVGGTTYTYFMRAKNSIGSRDSNTVTATTKSDCQAPLPPSISSIDPQTVTIVNGGFTLNIYGSNFDSTCKIGYSKTGETIQSYNVATTFIDSSHLAANGPNWWNSLFYAPGAYFVQVFKPYPDNPADGLRSGPASLTSYNPPPEITSISGTCKANHFCSPTMGYDVRMVGSGFVQDYPINGKASTYVEVGGQTINATYIGQGGPVYTQFQLYISESKIPTPGEYTIKACNDGTIQGTSCSTGTLSVVP
jgi:hypothetical protein